MVKRAWLLVWLSLACLPALAVGLRVVVVRHAEKAGDHPRDPVPPDTALVIPAEHAERALYPVSGASDLDGTSLPLNAMAVLERGSEPVLPANTVARLMLLGDAPLDGPRFVWWNFVSSRRERIEQAKSDWLNGNMGAVPGETEFIPLPD